MRALLLAGALLLAVLPPVAALTAVPVPLSLCFVQASYRPVSWPAWSAPEDRLRRILVELKPGCPPGGEARVVLINSASGRRLPERGAYTLRPGDSRMEFPRLFGSGLMPQWGVWWEAASGKLWRVTQTAPGGAP